MRSKRGFKSPCLENLTTTISITAKIKYTETAAPATIRKYSTKIKKNAPNAAPVIVVKPPKEAIKIAKKEMTVP